MSDNAKIRNAVVDDGSSMLALIPRLADFDLPVGRQPEQLWADDAALLRRWLAGAAPECLVQVAELDGRIAGFTISTMQPEPLSHEPSAHLEAIAVAPEAEGRGIGKSLLQSAEANAAKHGAQSMTLHVIATNKRARSLYERSGYCGELLRYIKLLRK